MLTTIIPLGISKGIRIPGLMLDESGFTDVVELEVKKEEMIIIPAILKKNITSDTLLLSEK